MNHKCVYDFTETRPEGVNKCVICGESKMTTNEQLEKQWRKEACFTIENSKSVHAPLDLYMLTEMYLAACKKRQEEQRKRNEKALESLKDVFKWVNSLHPREGRIKFHQNIETIKAALEER